MKKLRNALLVVLSLALVAGISIVGTAAYLKSEDSDVNVMTVGKVEIKQHEYERETNDDGTYKTDTIDDVTSYVLTGFTQDKALLPIVGDPSTGDAGWDTIPVRMSQVESYGGMNVFAGKNAQDKFVTVENTGKNDAYVRTLVAIEVGEADPALLGTSYHQTWTKNEVGTIVVNDINYMLFEYMYAGGELSDGSWRHKDGILPAGDTSYPNLSQVYIKSAATNEDMEKIDGNGDGKINILVLSQAVQTAGFADAKTALDTAFGAVDPTTAAKWFDQALDDAAGDTWDGTSDTSWYNDTDTEFTIETAEQLAGLAELVDGGNTFEGKTIKVGADLDLTAKDGKGELICFEPIGSYRNDTSFKGVFDGQGNTISNMSQNTWALDNGYYYGDLGLGLFGKVEDATVKDLIMDGASISGESAICGTVAATAYGDCTFENITVKNSEVADYQYYAGGIVGWASGDHKYINCNVDASSTIAAQWGDFDNSIGGVIGGAGGTATILLKDCNVACRIDAYNDVTSSYQWYAYRRAGMLIGNTGKTEVVGGTTYAAAPQLTAENVTVTYGDWANYTYCEFAGTSWPYVRVQAGVSNSAYSNPRYGHPTDANGNEVVDDSHVHNDGEDHFIECTFDQLYGGGQGVYGDSTHDGVTVVYNNK